MSENVEKGQEEAQTPADLVAIDDADGLAAADLLDLVDGSPDLLPLGGLAAAAELVASERRARGRPKGALNKRNTKLFEYLESLGHRDPGVTLSMWQTADTKELAKALGVDSAKGRMAVAALQVRAAAELMPYKYAKRPQQLELPGGDSKRPVMVIGEMNVAVMAASGVMSAGMRPNEKTIDNQSVSETDTVRQQGEQSHETGK